MGVDDVELQVEGAFAAEEVEHPAKELGAIFENVHRYGAPNVVKRHRREQAQQPKAMVAMQVADEYVPKPRELQVVAMHTQLGALAAVYHHQVASHIKHLA
jgi:hypothetical protein